MQQTNIWLEGVVCDMDGLVLDTEPLYKSAWQQALGELGHSLDEAAYLRFVGRTTAECENDLVNLLGEQFPLHVFRRRWPTLWRACAHESGIARKAGLPEFLGFVRGRGLPIALATSSDSAYTEFSLGKAGLQGVFDVVVTGDQVRHPKPAPDIYFEAALRLGVEPRNCIALEDSEAGILAASRAGMVSLLVPDLKQPTEKAVRAAYRVLDSLHDAPAVVAAFTRSHPPG
jgi:beta-phosphoglucomutase-like phosphatase (HAD superfamily)